MADPSRGDVAVCAVPGDYGKPRPVMVVQSPAVGALGLSSVVTCPFTTRLTGLGLCRVLVQPTAANGLRLPSEIAVERATAIEAHKLKQTIGRIHDATMAAVEHAVLFVFGMRTN